MADYYPFDTNSLIKDLVSRLQMTNYNADFDIRSSVLSSPIPSLDIPEITDLKLEFVYNYFTTDERVRRFRGNQNEIVTLSTANNSDQIFKVKSQKFPRAVKFNFKPAPEFTRTEENLANLRNINVEQNINAGKILIEGASSNASYQGFELIDTLADARLYEVFKNSLTVHKVQAEDSNTSKAHALADKIANNSLFGSDKKLILDTLGNMQAQGVQSLDTNSAQTAAYQDAASKQSFSIKIHKSLFGKITKNSTLNNSSVFEDEIRAIQPISNNISQQHLANNDFSNISSESDFVVPSISTSVATYTDYNSGNYPKIGLIGYVVQRTEISASGKPEKLSNIYVEDIRKTTILDTNVRYGYTYVYKIRSVALVETIAIRRLPNGTQQPVKTKFLMASEGIRESVRAVETVPPPPPTNISIRMHEKVLKPVVSWSFPVNITRDIKKFQVFKRLSVDEPFTLLREFDFDNSEIKSDFFEEIPASLKTTTLAPVLNFIDRDYVVGSMPIYSVVSLDAHGLSSGYSTQFQIRYDRYTNKLHMILVSKAGAPKPYPNIYLNFDTFKDTMKTSGFSRATIVFDPEYYKVKKNSNPSLPPDHPDNSSIDLKLIKFSANASLPKYKLQIINTDYQESETVSISVLDKTGEDVSVPVASINPNNLSFEFGTN